VTAVLDDSFPPDILNEEKETSNRITAVNWEDSKK